MRDALRGCWSMVVVAWQHDRRRLSAAVALTIASGLAWSLVAWQLRAATNAVLRHDPAAATVAGALVGVGAIGVLVLRHFAYTAYVEITAAAVITLEAELMVLANGSPGIEHHERPEYADKIGILRRELSALMQGMGGLLAMLALTVSMTSAGIMLSLVSPWLLLLPVAALPPLFAGQRAARIVDGAKERSAAATRQSLHLFDLATSASSAQELRVAGVQEHIRRRTAMRWADAGAVLRAGELRAAGMNAAGQLFFAAAYIGSVLVVVRQAVAGQSQVGDIVLVIALAAQVNQQVNAGLVEFRNLQRISYGFTRLRWLRTLVAGRQAISPAVDPPERITTGIALRQLSFRYPGSSTPVLTDVSVTLAAGSTVAVVGENGAGKSTLVKLMGRFYEPSEGRITVDGTDLRAFPVAAWRQRMAAGFQDFVRLEVPAVQAVGVGDLPRADDEDAVRGALERACAVDVVRQLPDGLATRLGKSYSDGAELSGGQWQKLALGRAMMRENPLILVLDEPTSALDAQAEHALFTRYAEHAHRVGRKTGAITVLVSHRFSTARMADLILVMADGAVVEAGDHDTLMAGGGLYAELYTLQASAYQS